MSKGQTISAPVKPNWKGVTTNSELPLRRLKRARFKRKIHGSVLSCPQASSPVDASLAQPTIPEVTEPQPLALFDIVQELYLRVGGGMGRRHTRPIAKVKSR